MSLVVVLGEKGENLWAYCWKKVPYVLFSGEKKNKNLLHYVTSEVVKCYTNHKNQSVTLSHFLSTNPQSTLLLPLKHSIEPQKISGLNIILHLKTF